MFGIFVSFIPKKTSKNKNAKKTFHICSYNSNLRLHLKQRIVINTNEYNFEYYLGVFDDGSGRVIELKCQPPPTTTTTTTTTPSTAAPTTVAATASGGTATTGSAGTGSPASTDSVTGMLLLLLFMVF